MGFNSINFGMMSTGPLFQYAILSEYSKKYNYKSLLWLFNPDNDFYDLSNEIKNKILIRYYENDKFSQNLINRNYQKDEVVKDFFCDYNLHSTSP